MSGGVQQRLRSGGPAAGPVPEALNEVRLVGRISAQPQERELPSGDRLVALRVVVPRSPVAGRGGTARAAVDAIEVACWSARTRRAAGSLGAGDVVEVTGALRRRFYRTGGGPASRHEVEAVTLRRIHRAGVGKGRRGERRSDSPAPG
jgi:single-strand DNA-binding protein